MNARVERLPHRAPFVFVTEVRGLDASGAFVAIWQATGDEAFFAGHFPGDPVVPGVLLVEALAQAAGLSLLEGNDATHDARAHGGMLAHAEVRFRSRLIPPVEVVLEVRRDSEFGSLTRFEVVARGNGAVAAEGSLVLAVPPRDG